MSLSVDQVRFNLGNLGILRSDLEMTGKYLGDSGRVWNIVRDGISSSTQPNVERGKEIPRGGKKRLPASGTLRAGLFHSGTSASACVLHPSFKSRCSKFTWSFGTYQRGVKDQCAVEVAPSQSEGTPRVQG